MTRLGSIQKKNHLIRKKESEIIFKSKIEIFIFLKLCFFMNKYIKQKVSVLSKEVIENA